MVLKFESEHCGVSPWFMPECGYDCMKSIISVTTLSWSHFLFKSSPQKIKLVHLQITNEHIFNETWEISVTPLKAHATKIFLDNLKVNDLSSLIHVFNTIYMDYFCNVFLYFLNVWIDKNNEKTLKIFLTVL